MTPLNYYKPIIENIVAMNPMNIVTFAISGTDCTSVVICLLRLGLARIVRRGRITLSVRRALRFISEKMTSIKLQIGVLLL